MAKLDAGLLFTGTLQNISAYKMRGSDKIILRMKGGASKEKIRKDPCFDVTRRNNAEFGGRSSASKWVLRALQPLKPVADYNWSAALNPLLKPVQQLDTVGSFGQRSVEVSKFPALLEGFNLNRGTPLDALVQNPLKYHIKRDTLSAEVEVPALMPRINFAPQGKYPMYRVVVALGIVPDLFYDDVMERYKPKSDPEVMYTQNVVSDLFPVKTGSPQSTLPVQLYDSPASGNFSLVLSAGICYGIPGAHSVIEVVKYFGSGRILSVV